VQIFLFISLFIAILAVIFALQNTAQVTVSFLIWNFQGSLALVLLLSLSVGALISFLASLPTLLKSRWSIRGHKRKLIEMEASLNLHKVELEATQKKLQEQEKAIQSQFQPSQLPRPSEPPQPPQPPA
jgi:uncharacterized integral membrane protein